MKLSPLTEQSAAELRQALMNFAPKMKSVPQDLNAAWSGSILSSLVGPRSWAHVVTMATTIRRNETIPLAIKRLREMFITEEPPGPMRRGAVLIPDGQYELERELCLDASVRSSPWFDLIGQSKGGTIITYGAHDNGATLYTKATQSLIAHMTLRRTGVPSWTTRPDVRYAIHDNTPADTPRTTLFVDLDCQTPEDPNCTGVGTGVAAGGLHIYAGVNSNHGFFAHNADEIREAVEAGAARPTPNAPAALLYLGCTSGLPNPVTARFGCAITYWNCGSGQPDYLGVFGGSHDGRAYGLRVIDFGPPFSGASETRVEIGHDVALYSGVDVPVKTMIRDMR